MTLVPGHPGAANAVVPAGQTWRLTQDKVARGGRARLCIA